MRMSDLEKRHELFEADVQYETAPNGFVLQQTRDKSKIYGQHDLYGSTIYITRK